MAQPSASLLVDFAEEVTEHVEAAEQVLLRAETQSADAADINLLFRSFHSVKGLARVVGFEAAEMRRTIACDVDSRDTLGGVYPWLTAINTSWLIAV